MADKMLLSFAALLSLVILAAGSRSPPGVQAVALQGTAYGSYECVYTIYVETGSIWKAGTDAVIGVAFWGADGGGFTIADLVRWGGLMGAGRDYYERGNVDVFSGRGPCLPSPPCRMNLTSDGSGEHHGWYCKSVEVTTTRRHAGCARAEFGVEQWLATDAPPYQLYTERSICAKSKSGDAEE
ncbi:PLAT domain-containing protein 3-like [Phragmites australis]|uniref:PLAT domain-containing protein 3-like n=1 Tax=Phragmites australis TaxID=29695 RepID=UPI002D765EBB|nr:PLAT domain-containing protein 3-like [Phragmites australis]